MWTWNADVAGSTRAPLTHGSRIEWRKSTPRKEVVVLPVFGRQDRIGEAETSFALLFEPGECRSSLTIPSNVAEVWVW